MEQIWYCRFWSKENWYQKYILYSSISRSLFTKFILENRLFVLETFYFSHSYMHECQAIFKSCVYQQWLLQPPQDVTHVAFTFTLPRWKSMVLHTVYICIHIYSYIVYGCICMYVGAIGSFILANSAFTYLYTYNILFNIQQNCVYIAICCSYEPTRRKYIHSYLKPVTV